MKKRRHREKPRDVGKTHRKKHKTLYVTAHRDAENTEMKISQNKLHLWKLRVTTKLGSVIY